MTLTDRIYSWGNEPAVVNLSIITLLALAVLALVVTMFRVSRALADLRDDNDRLRRHLENLSQSLSTVRARIDQLEAALRNNPYSRF